MFGSKSLYAAIVMTAALALPVLAPAQLPAACDLVNAKDAEKFVGGPLDVRETAPQPIDNTSGAYTSVCTYIARGIDVSQALTAPRVVDFTLFILDTPRAMATIYENSLNHYSQAAAKSDPRFKNSKVEFLPGHGDKAFVFEAITDPSGYKSVLIVFYKGRVGGSIAAWRKPDSALESGTAVLRHILNRLPQ